MTMFSVILPENPQRRIKPSSVFRLYVMLKAQFNGKYDAVQYQWKIRISDSAFKKRKDQFFFNRLSEKYLLSEQTLLFISNFLNNESAWVGEISDSDAITHYKEYQKRLSSITEVYKEDIRNIKYFSRKMNISLNDVFNQRDDNPSYLIKMLQSRIVSPETVLLLDSFLGIIATYDKTSVVQAQYLMRLEAYKKLAQIDKYEAKKIFVDVVKNCKMA